MAPQPLWPEVPLQEPLPEDQEDHGSHPGDLPVRRAPGRRVSSIA
jgi:hypothetical protein